LLAYAFRIRKVTTDPHNVAHENIDCPDERCPKLKVYISELILGRYESKSVAYVTMHCVI